MMRNVKYFWVVCTAFSLLTASENSAVSLEDSDQHSDHRERKDRHFGLDIFPIQNLKDPSLQLNENNAPFFNDNRPGILPSTNETYELDLDPNYIGDGPDINDDILNPNNMSAANCLIDSVYGAHSACGPIYFIYGYHLDRHKDSQEVDDKKHIYNLYCVLEDKDKLPELNMDVWDFTLPYYVMITPQGEEKYDLNRVDAATHTYHLYYCSGLEFIEREMTIDHVFYLIKNEPMTITPEQVESLRKKHQERTKNLQDEKDVCDGPVNIYHIYDVDPQGEVKELTLINQFEVTKDSGKEKHTYRLDKRIRGFHFDPLGILEDQDLLKMMNQFFYMYSYACFPMYGFDEGGDGGGVGAEGGGSGGTGGGNIGGYDIGGSGGSGGSGGNNNTGFSFGTESTGSTTTGTTATTTTGTGTTTTTATTTTGTGTTTTTGTATETGTTVATSAGRTTTVTNETGHITVPEPSTYLILGAGLLVVAFVKYRSKKRAKNNPQK